MRLEAPQNGIDQPRESGMMRFGDRDPGAYGSVFGSLTVEQLERTKSKNISDFGVKLVRTFQIRFQLRVERPFKAERAVNERRYKASVLRT